MERYFDVLEEQGAMIVYRFDRYQLQIDSGLYGHHLRDLSPMDWKYGNGFIAEKVWNVDFRGSSRGFRSTVIFTDFVGGTWLDCPSATVEMVIKPHGVVDRQILATNASVGLNHVLVDNYKSGWYIWIEDSQLHIKMGFRESPFNTVHFFDIACPIEDETWQHISVRASLEGFNVVVNGRRMAVGTTGFVLGIGAFEGDTGLTIGEDYPADGSGGLLFNGEIDAFAMFNSYSTNEEIYRRYLSLGFGGPYEPMSGTSRATVLQGIQVAKELAPGFGGAATIRLKNMMVTPKPEIPVSLVRYQGDKAYSDTQVAQEAASMPISGVIDFNTIPLLLDCLMGHATPTSPGAGAARQRVYTPATASELTHPDTLVVESGSSKGAERMTYGFCTGLTLRAAKEEAAIEGTMVGQQVQRNITITPGLSVLQPAAAHPKNISWFISTNGSSYTKLKDVINGEIGLNGLWAPTYHQSDDNLSFDEIHEQAPEFTGQIVLEEGTEADSFMGWLRNSTVVYIGMKVVGDLIEAGTGILDPTGPPKVNVLTTGGTMAAGTRYVAFTYKNGLGETLLSPSVAITTTGSTSRALINAGQLPVNATGINAYMSTDNITFKLHGTSSTGTYIMGSVTVTTDAGVSNTSGTMPIYQLIRVNMPVFVHQTDPGDHDGVYGNQFNLSVADDETFGLASVTVVNAIAAY